MKKIVYVILSVFVFCACADYSIAWSMEKEITRVFDFSHGGNFTLKNYRGAVRIESGDYQSIELYALVKVNVSNKSDAQDLLESTELEVKSASPHDVSLKISTDEQLLRELQNSGIFGWFGGSDGPLLEIDCVVKVPREVSLDIQTYKGDVFVADIEGGVKVKDYKGEVIIKNIDGDVSAETYKERMELENIDGSVTVRNYKDTMTLRRIEGKIFAKNYKGTIRAEVFALSNDAEYEFSTYKDEVILYLPAGINADLKIDNRKGDIHSDFPLSVLGELSGDKFTGRINNGGIPLSITNYKGSVLLKQL